MFAECKNKVCQCRLGFQGDGVLNCHDCSICHPNAICSPSVGCTCPGPHLIGDGKSCKTRDECRIDSDCRDPKAVCTLQSGSLKCACILGYIKLFDNLCTPIRKMIFSQNRLYNSIQLVLNHAGRIRNA